MLGAGVVAAGPLVRLNDAGDHQRGRMVVMDPRGVPSPPSRSSLPLCSPSTGSGIVLANFNSGHKIDPQVFGVWMAILRQCPECQLWLLEVTWELGCWGFCHLVGLLAAGVNTPPPPWVGDWLAWRIGALVAADTLPGCAHV
jgi:hypothetical protein